MVHNGPDTWEARMISFVRQELRRFVFLDEYKNCTQEEGVLELSKTRYLFLITKCKIYLQNRPLSDWKFVSKSEVNMALWLASIFL